MKPSIGYSPSMKYGVVMNSTLQQLDSPQPYTSSFYRQHNGDIVKPQTMLIPREPPQIIYVNNCDIEHGTHRVHGADRVHKDHGHGGHGHGHHSHALNHSNQVSVPPVVNVIYDKPKSGMSIRYDQADISLMNSSTLEADQQMMSRITEMNFCKGVILILNNCNRISKSTIDFLLSKMGKEHVSYMHELSKIYFENEESSPNSINVNIKYFFTRVDDIIEHYCN